MLPRRSAITVHRFLHRPSRAVKSPTGFERQSQASFRIASIAVSHNLLSFYRQLADYYLGNTMTEGHLPRRDSPAPTGREDASMVDCPRRFGGR